MKKIKKIACLGASLTCGYPYGMETSWVTYVSRMFPFSFINAGINGNTLEDMAERYVKDVKSHHPDVVVILGGTNDAFSRDISCAQSIYSLKSIVVNALQEDVEPVIAIPIPVIDNPFTNTKLQHIISEERRLADEFQLKQLDFGAPFFDTQGVVREDLYLDGVHPNRTGYEIMGKTAIEFFRHYFQKFLSPCKAKGGPMESYLRTHRI